MSIQSFETDLLLPDDLIWNCEAADMRGSQQFMSTIEDLARYNATTSVLDTTTRPSVFSQVTTTRSASDALKPCSRTERKLEINRMSQKRVRERRKARIQSTEAQLIDTAAQLQDLKSRNKLLEARNTLLEKVANLHGKPAASAGSEATLLPWQDSGLMVESSDKGPTIKITINGYEQIFTVDNVRQMPELRYADLYARYASKLGTCLLEASEDGSNPAGRQLVQWVSEATSLMVCMAHGNPRLALKIGLADFTSNHQEQGAELSPRQEPFFVDLLVALELTESQQQDMMYLRRLLYSKLGQIYRDRKVVLSSMPTESDGVCQSSDKLADMTDSADQLRNSAAEELNTYMQFASAFFRGIQTCKQHAILIVHSYPSIPQKGRLLELLASQRGEPPKEVLMQSAGLDNLQHAANWQQVVDYLCGVNAGNINQHVQLFAE